MLNVIILNVIFGVIVDTFGFLRDQTKVRRRVRFLIDLFDLLFDLF